MIVECHCPGRRCVRREATDGCTDAHAGLATDFTQSGDGSAGGTGFAGNSADFGSWRRNIRARPQTAPRACGKRIVDREDRIPQSRRHRVGETRKPQEISARRGSAPPARGGCVRAEGEARQEINGN